MLRRRIDQVRLTIHPGAERWAPPARILKAISARLSRPVHIELAPRSQIGQIWKRDHDGQPLPVHPYAFRAYSRDGRATIFVDETETPGSVLWLLLHELAHLDLTASKLLCSAYRYQPKPANYLTSDEGHEAHPEEQLANMVATETLRQLGLPPAPLDRLWWRARVRARGLDAT